MTKFKRDSVFVLFWVALLVMPWSQEQVAWPRNIHRAVEVVDSPAPIDNEACFSPDEPCAIKLQKFIQSAQRSIDLAIYDINEDQVVHWIMLQSKKISVRVIVDARQARGAHSAVGLLLKAGVSVRVGHQRGIMHNKFTIIDGQRLELGSFNYTHHASQQNQENQLYLSNPQIVERYKKRFEKMWRESSEARSFQ